MPSITHRLFPITPPPAPTPITREPVAHRFWGGGMVALAMGFALGIYLWCLQWGIFSWTDYYPDLRLLHGRIQIILFAGSFILGFGLQAGPHVIGGTPPASRSTLQILFPLWFGFLLGTLPDPSLRMVGNALVSLAFFGAAIALAGVVRGADPQRALPVGIPLVIGVASLGIAPWLPLGQVDWALVALLTGPVSCILAVVQHLVANILGGHRPSGPLAHLFTTVWFLAWLAAWGSALLWVPWSWSGLLWALLAVWLVVAVRLLPVLLTRPLESISVTLVAGLAALPLAGILVFMGGYATLDAALHLVGIGMVVTMILGVTARVVGFFSGGLVMHDRLLSILLVAWMGVAALRTAIPLGILQGTFWVPIAALLAAGLLIWWSMRVSSRLLAFSQRAKSR
ncbi:MAG: NnrS family protein [Magnetococcus sp. DMHC-1]|nr:NnrS family protein [Magnetococcales bacterium]